MSCLILLFLLGVEGETGCSDQPSCRFCTIATSDKFNSKCQWCPTTNKCYSPSDLTESCSGTAITSKSACPAVPTPISPAQDYADYCGGTVPPSSEDNPANTSAVALYVVNRAKQFTFVEFIPSDVQKLLAVTYGTDTLSSSGGRSTAALSCKSLTKSYGPKYTSTKWQQTQEDVCSFIKTYSINLTEAADLVSNYVTMNAFFYRKLTPSARSFSTTPGLVLSPADSRLLAFAEVSAATRLWIKGRSFSVSSLLIDDPRWNCQFTSPAIVINRLAPQDYHRFHVPITGKIVRILNICGEYWSVNPIAVINQDISVFTENKRTIIEIAVDSTELPSGSSAFSYLFIAVGATNVASINILSAVGDRVVKGQELGYFAFGGSTTLLVFPQGAVTFDADLTRSATVPIENFVRVGEQIGTLTSFNYSTTICSELAMANPVTCGCLGLTPSRIVVALAILVLAAINC